MSIRPSFVCPSSVVNLSLKILIYQKRPDNFYFFWCTTSFGRYPCTVKIWIWLSHPKGHFNRSERSNLAIFLNWRQFSQELFDQFVFYLYKKLPNEVLMNCQQMDSIESL